MKRLVVILCTLLAAAHSSAAVQEMKVDTVLDRMAQALGGRERLARVKNVYSRFTLEAAGLKGNGEGWITMDGRSRSTYDLAGVDSGLSVFDGKTAWAQDANGTVREKGAPKTADDISSAYFDTYSFLLPGRRAGTVELVGDDSTRTFYVLRMLPQGGKPLTVYVDKSTWLPTKVERPTSDRTSAVTYSDWRSVDGVSTAFAARQSEGGDPKYDVVVTVVETKFDVPVEDSRFGKPGAVERDTVFADGRTVVEVPFELVKNHIYVKVGVGGSQPLAMIFDTGAERSLISLERAKALKLPILGAVEARGSGEGTMEASLIKEVTFELPGVKVPARSIVSLSLSALEAFEGRQMDGILGYDFIHNFVSEIDYERRTIRLHDPACFTYSGKGQRIPIQLTGNIPRIHGAVLGEGRERLEGTFMIDTGSNASLSLTRPFIQSSWLAEPAAKALAATYTIGIGAQTKTRVGRVDALEIGGFRVVRPITGFDFDERGGGADRDIAGNIGGEILRRFKVYFDYSRAEMILEPTARLSEPFEYDMLGAFFVPAGAGRGLKILSVLEPSPASEAGLLKGDVIIAFDGRDVEQIGSDQLRRTLREPGREVTVTVRRGAETLQRKAKLRRMV